MSDPEFAVVLRASGKDRPFSEWACEALIRQAHIQMRKPGWIAGEICPWCLTRTAWFWLPQQQTYACQECIEQTKKTVGLYAIDHRHYAEPTLEQLEAKLADALDAYKRKVAELASLAATAPAPTPAPRASTLPDWARAPVGNSED